MSWYTCSGFFKGGKAEAHEPSHGSLGLAEREEEVDSWIADEDGQLVIFSEGEKVSFRDQSVLDRVLQLPEMERDLALCKQDYASACKTIADMHAAAVGEVTGPRRGVVEDVEDLRVECDRLRETISLAFNALSDDDGLDVDVPLARTLLAGGESA